MPIFAGRDGEGNEQKLGEEWGQAKQWKFVLKKNLRSINTSLIRPQNDPNLCDDLLNDNPKQTLKHGTTTNP